MEAASPQVRLRTTSGDILLELDAVKAPVTTKNFIAYVTEGFFDGTIFHRVIPNFMIQGGGLTPDMSSKKTRAPIRNEASNGLENRRGSISMARTSDPHSATCQFFINVRDNASLNPGPGSDGYAVFGRVLEGMDVVDGIVAAPTTQRAGHRDVPQTPIVIESARIETPESQA